MSRITACPQCQTRFRVTEEQLQARGGKVRCGRCEHVFNALESLTEEPPLQEVEPVSAQQADVTEQDLEFHSAQEMTIASGPEERPDETSPSETTDISEPLFELEPPPTETSPEAEEPLFDLELTHPETTAGTPPFVSENRSLTPSDEAFTAPAAATEPASEAQPALPASEPEPEPEPEPESKAEARVIRIQPSPIIIQPKVSPASPKYAPPPKPKRAWPWILANLLLLMGLTGQGLYFFRDTVAAHYPATRPLLEEACVYLDCRVSLPRNPDLISIETSELHADPARANIVVLSSMLRNRATHAQAYPTLELTLTNTRDEMVARILFTPREYLRPPASVTRGIAPGEEVAVKLLLDLGNLKAEGYRLYLFYPS